MQEIFKNIIILTQDDNKAIIDRQAFKHAGYKSVITHTSGLSLALELADVHINRLQRETLVFCQPQLADMTALEFLKLIRLHPLLFHQPLVFIGSDEKESKHYLEAGFSYAITRPFTALALEEAINFCIKFEEARRKKIQALVHAKKILPNSSTFFAQLEELRLQRLSKPEKADVQTALYDALELLKRGQVQKATPLLLKATNNPDTAGKAFETLASMYKEEGDTKQYLRCLVEAIKSYAYINENSKMLELAEVYKASTEYPLHPLINDLVRYIKENRLQDFAQKLVLLEPIITATREMQGIVNACLASENPQSSAKELGEYLANKNYSFASELLNVVERKHNEKIKDRQYAKQTKQLREEKRKKDIATLQQERIVQSKKVLLTKIDVENLPEFGSGLDKIPQIPLIDEGEEKVYLESERKNLIWSIIKGTASVYKNMK